MLARIGMDPATWFLFFLFGPAHSSILDLEPGGGLNSRART